jgi:hypothetical protein
VVLRRHPHRTRREIVRQIGEKRSAHTTVRLALCRASCPRQLLAKAARRAQMSPD